MLRLGGLGAYTREALTAREEAAASATSGGTSNAAAIDAAWRYASVTSGEGQKAMTAYNTGAAGWTGTTSTGATIPKPPPPSPENLVYLQTNYGTPVSAADLIKAAADKTAQEQQGQPPQPGGGWTPHPFVPPYALPYQPPPMSLIQYGGGETASFMDSLKSVPIWVYGAAAAVLLLRRRGGGSP